MLPVACGTNHAAISPSLPLDAPAHPATPSGEARTLTILTHESFALSDAVLQQFEQANNAKVNFIKQGDAGQALSRAILTKDNPEADVIFGVDNTFMGRALDAEILDAYQPIGRANVPQEFQLDPTQQLIPIDYGDVCLNYDKAYFEQKQLPPPQKLADLTKPDYKNLLVSRIRPVHRRDWLSCWPPSRPLVKIAGWASGPI